MPKNLVICCDGTNNDLAGDHTNVARVSQLAIKQPGLQHVYYDAGVGAKEVPGFMTRIGKRLSKVAGLAFGAGLVDNVSEAYLEIVRNYEPGDRVFLFGFSRGSYTVRVLAGLLFHYGLLRKENDQLARDVIKEFRNFLPDDSSPVGRDPVQREAYVQKAIANAATFKAANSIDCPIHFVGIWDTVSSLGWVYEPKKFPNTAQMPNVKIIRHALALDERRAKFRTNRVRVWDAAQQDLQEIWFPGVHSDVGGGYPASESGLAISCLRWMLLEAKTAGLLLDHTGVKALDVDKAIAANDPYFATHESLTGAWWALEYVRLPHRRLQDGKFIDEKIRYGGKGWRTINKNDCADQCIEVAAPPITVKNVNWATARTTLTWANQSRQPFPDS
jgi:uncharacterized protein (DUF2235 family)